MKIRFESKLRTEITFSFPDMCSICAQFLHNFKPISVIKTKMRTYFLSPKTKEYTNYA